MAGTPPLTTFVWCDLSPRPGWEQMALDHASLDRATEDGTALLRLYRWAGDTVSFGANEAAVRSWDRTQLDAHKQLCVRRPTGGRAVWHAADDLTYAVTAPLELFGGLRPAYRAIHERLAAAFGRLGLPAELAPEASRHPGLEPGACFDMAVGGEVLIGGRKTVGSAQLAAGPSLLQHGAIALADRSAELARFALRNRLGGPAVAISSPAVPRATAARAAHAGEPIAAAADLAHAIASEWLAGDAAPATDELIRWAEEASKHHATRYRDPAWTWRR